MATKGPRPNDRNDGGIAQLVERGDADIPGQSERGDPFGSSQRDAALSYAALEAGNFKRAQV